MKRISILNGLRFIFHDNRDEKKKKEFKAFYNKIEVF